MAPSTTMPKSAIGQLMADIQSTFAARRAELSVHWARRKAYRQSIYELQGLSDRELADLGFYRCDISAIAHASVYGEA